MPRYPAKFKIGDYVALTGGTFADATRALRATEGKITSFSGDYEWIRIAGEPDGYHEESMELTEPEDELALKLLGEDYFA